MASSIPNVAKQGFDHAGCVMTREMVVEARQRVRQGDSLESIANDFDVGATTVCNAVTGVTFSDIIEEPPISSTICGFNSKHCKVRRDEVPSIIKRLESGEPMQSIAKNFDCHPRTVRQAVRRYECEQKISDKGV